LVKQKLSISCVVVQDCESVEPVAEAWSLRSFSCTAAAWHGWRNTQWQLWLSG